MPRPTRDGKPSTGDIRAALASLKENQDRAAVERTPLRFSQAFEILCVRLNIQEQSLAAIDALLRSVEDVEAEPRKLEAPGQSMAVKFKTDLVEEQDAKVQLTLPELPDAAKRNLGPHATPIHRLLCLLRYCWPRLSLAAATASCRSHVCLCMGTLTKCSPCVFL